MFSSLEDDRFSFGHDEDSVFDAMLARGGAQTLERFFNRLVTQSESSVVHRDERFRIQLLERDDSFFGIHMNFARERRIVSADRQKRDLDVVTFANFFEAFEVGGVAAMKNRSPIGADDETAEAAMSVSEKARAPMMRRRERDTQRAELDRLPFVKLVDNVESEPMNQSPNSDRNDDGLIGCDRAQRSPIEVIEVGVSDEDEIDRRQMVNVKSGFLESFDHAEPHRPDRVDQDVGVMRLNQERRVTDPGDANLAGLNFWKERPRARARTSRKERRDPDAGDEIAFGPGAARTQLDSLRFFGAAVLGVAHYLPLSRKRIRHRRRTI